MMFTYPILNLLLTLGFQLFHAIQLYDHDLSTNKASKPEKILLPFF